jgi:hypothetical protein
MALNRDELLTVLARSHEDGQVSRPWVVYKCSLEEFTQMALECLCKREDFALRLTREIFGSLCDLIRIVDFRVDSSKSRINQKTVSLHASFELWVREGSREPISVEWLKKLP